MFKAQKAMQTVLGSGSELSALAFDNHHRQEVWDEISQCFWKHL